MSVMNVGIIGLGVGEQHIAGFRDHPHSEVVALCDFSMQKARDVSEKYNGIRVTVNADDIIEDPAIDVVSIASYDNFHFEQARRSIENGKHVFVEKPMCLYEHEARQLKQLLEKTPGAKLSCNLSLRTCPRFVRLKQAIASGEMGDLFYVNGAYLWGRAHKITQGWRREMEFYSIILGAGVHMIDLIMWLTGDRPVEVQGYGNRIAINDAEFPYNDFASLQFKFRNGLVAHVSCSGGCVHPHFHNLEVCGSERTYIQNVNGAKWIDSSDPEAEMRDVSEAYPARENRIDLIRSFVDHLVDESVPPVVSSEDTFAVMSACFAAEKAISEGKPVEIDYL